jgi:glycosyltransferase involved in cell wall biosynthesis
VLTEPATLSVVMPAYNEEAGIARAVEAALVAGDEVCRPSGVDGLEVVVVDDGSTDGTASIVSALAARDDRIRLVRLGRNRGLGGALRAGLAASTGDIVLYTDADLPFDLAEIGKALRLMRLYDADVVAAYRHDRTGEGFRRALYSHAYSVFVKVVLGLHLRDVNFAAKWCRREVVETIELHSEGSFVDAELLAKAVRHGFKVVQFGVDYFPRSRGVSTLSSFRVIRTILAEMRSITPEIRAIGSRGPLG